MIMRSLDLNLGVEDCVRIVEDGQSSLFDIQIGVLPWVLKSKIVVLCLVVERVEVGHQDVNVQVVEEAWWVCPRLCSASR